MIWNLFIHIIAGIVGYRIFAFQYPGFVYCLVMTVVIQGIDMFRIHCSTKKHILRASPHIRDRQLKDLKGSGYFYKLAQIYVAKIVFYGLVILVSSSIMRQIMAE